MGSGLENPVGSGLENPSPCPKPNLFCCFLPISQQNFTFLTDFPLKPFPNSSPVQLPRKNPQRSQSFLEFPIKAEAVNSRREWPGFDRGMTPPDGHRHHPSFFTAFPFFFLGKRIPKASLTLPQALGIHPGKKGTAPLSHSPGFRGEFRENPGKKKGKRGCGAQGKKGKGEYRISFCFPLLGFGVFPNKC